MLEACVIVNVVEVDDPDDGTLPVPVQPVQTYCVPVGPATGELIDAVMLVSESNHPLVGVGVP